MQRDLTALFDPSSVAIVGASDDPAKWGNWLARGALQGEHRRPVYLINHKGTPVLGHDTYRSISDLPSAPELVVVSVPAGAFEQTVDDALAIGAHAFVGITAGLGESGATPRSASASWSSECGPPARSCSAPTAWGCSTTPPSWGSAPTSSPPARSD